MAEPTTEIPPVEEVLKGKIVLVVDDDEDLAPLISRAFARKGAIVEIAKNGKEALQKIKGKKIDLVFTDNSMPIMGGIELIEEIRKDPLTQNLPIILASGDVFAGLSPEETQEKALSLQANVGMAKPFTSIFAPVTVAEQLLSAKQS